jgi:PAS domain S-box-containing protein
MDIRLQGEMDGITAAAEIRERLRLPVIYLTAFSEEQTLQRAKVTEPFGYIIKPFEDREIQSAIEMALYKHQAEQRLRESERRYITTLKSIGDGVIATDERGRVTFMNPVAERLSGWTLTEAGGRPLPEIFRIMNEQTRQTVEDPVARVLREGITVGLANHSLLISRDGREIPIDDCAAPIRDDQGGLTGTVLVFQDVSERRKQEAELRLSEARYRSLFEANPHPMWVFDLETLAFLMVNDAAVEQYGYTRDEFAAMTIKDIRPLEDVPRLLENVARVGEQRWDPTDVWQHRKKDGSLIDVEITSHFLDFQGRRARLVLANDITERRRAEEEKTKLQEQLLQAQKMESVARLAGGVAHDFNNMLSAILGHAELAELQLNPAEPIYADLEVIRKAAQRSAELVRQLLAFARKQTVAPQVLDLNDTVAGMLKMLLRLIGEDIELAWLPGAGLWPVNIDPSQIDQILANLCVNARDAIAGVGKITIETENVLFDEEYCSRYPGFSSGQYVMLGVSDTGTGMSKEVLEHLFEPFFTTKEVGKGTGLGLATVYGIVKQNEGFIHVYSEPGRGATFKIYLPRFIGQMAGRAKERAGALPRGAGETVLLVEDEAVILHVGKAMLENLGYRVLAAGSPAEAVQLAAAHTDELQLLITDVIMPVMNGRDLAQLIQEIKPGLKVLFTSGYTANVIAHQGVLDEGVCFLQKPLSMKNLAVKIRQVLEQN